jgi:hypothetical protein
MQKLDHGTRAHVSAVRHSLSAIKKAHVQLDLTNASNSPTELASQIQLCDVLLFEISGIRSNLAKRIKGERSGLRGVRQHLGLNG